MQYSKIIDLRKFISNYNSQKENCLNCLLDRLFLYDGIVIEAELTRDSIVHQTSTTTYQKRNLELLIQLKKELIFPLIKFNRKDKCKYIKDQIILESNNKQEIYHFIQRLKLEARYHFN